MEAFSEHFSRLDPEQRRVVELYQQVAGAMNELYFAILERTTYKEWEDPFRMNPEDRGIGDCHLSTADSAQEIEDEALLKLRTLRSAETPGPQFGHVCGHHRIGVGCILGDLKSPFCLRYFRNPLLDEMRRRFGSAAFNQFDTARSQAMKTLKIIQEPDVTLMRKETLVQEVISLIHKAKESVELFPTLLSR